MRTECKSNLVAIDEVKPCCAVTTLHAVRLNVVAGSLSCKVNATCEIVCLELGLAYDGGKTNVYQCGLEDAEKVMATRLTGIFH